MLTFCILENKKTETNIKIVETGFSFLAFFFGPIWGLYKTLWGYSFLGITLLLGFRVILENIDLGPFFFFIALLSSVFWGFFARDLYIQNLIGKEFFPIKLVNAPTKENAILKYLSETSQ
jgi:hypothetical protein